MKKNIITLTLFISVISLNAFCQTKWFSVKIEKNKMEVTETENSVKIVDIESKSNFEFKKGDYKLTNDSLSLKIKSIPISITNNNKRSINSKGIKNTTNNQSESRGCCNYLDECNGSGETGCTQCAGFLMFCCGGGLKGGCIGGWVCDCP